MAALSLSASAGEALVLGLATGPVCLATCGPVVVPWMMVQPRGMRVHSGQLGLFLAARLAGYLVFAAAAWLVGSSILRASGGRAGSGQPWIIGLIQVLLAAGLVFYAFGWPRRKCAAANPVSGEASAQHHVESRLVHIGEAPRPLRSGALALGFLTGINLCPPFLVAGLRAAQLQHLWAALLFFVCFFAGTAIWFLPFLSLSFVERSPAVVIVARMVAVLLACWYLFSGVSVLVNASVVS
ncbi:MAG TPA: sulfite exporter TauE/SafE family protein [Terracidiphilus sp.]|nr:sulfite exporter TauE/SafE family protein [Terracidiphilus sp.]